MQEYLLLFFLYPLLILSQSSSSEDSTSQDDTSQVELGSEDLVCPFTNISTIPNGGIDPNTPDIYTYNTALLTLDISSVFRDIFDLLTDSQDCFPADTLGGSTNYGGLFIRLAWHCSGSFRSTDGQGGCAGGRQRFDPEASWDDNVQLDKARALLTPIKLKYGDALRYTQI